MDGTPPTGRTIDYPLASFAQIESDKIRSQDIYLDRQTIAEQLGLKPKKNETTAITEEKKTPCELKNTKGMAVGKDRPERCSPDEHGRPMRLHSPSKARRARGGCATQNVKAYWAQQMSIYTREISEAV
jgi:hypothetical protein